MRRIKRAAIVAIALVLIAGVLIYSGRRSGSAAPIVGVVRATEVRVEPEVNGQLVSIAVEKGAHVHAGDVLATLSAVELTAQADQARAALASATANRNNVYAGVRREQVASLKAEIAKASARLEYLQLQLTRTTTLARQNFESQQSLDQAENDAAGARADVAEAQANYDAAVAGPTREERAVADAQVQAAAAALAVLERRLDKMTLRAPADGVVSVIAAEVGENVRAGQPILMVEAADEQWLSFNAREDHLGGLTMGKPVSVTRNGADGAIKAVITELRPLGTFATWQAERVIGDHDRNTLRLRLDPEGQPAGLEPGMTVWIEKLAGATARP
jgi:HlyD family secretion protein